MATKRIYQIAKEFESDEKKIIEFLTGQGIKVANRLSAVSEDTYNLLKTKLFAPPPPEPPPAPPEPKLEPVITNSEQNTPQAADNKDEPTRVKKKKKKKKNSQLTEQTTDTESQEQDSTSTPLNLENFEAATKTVSNEAIVAGNDFVNRYVSAKMRKKKHEIPQTVLSRNMSVWGLLEDLRINDPDSSPILYWQAVNKLTTKAFKLMNSYGMENRELLAEMRENVKSVGAKYEPQEIFTEEENQKFAAQQNFLFETFGHGMGKVNDNLYELKMYAENKKKYCEHMSFVDYLRNPDNKLELKVPMPFYALAETVLYSVRSVPCHVKFYEENKDNIIKSIENFFTWIEGYKKLKEQGADSARLEKYLDLEEKFFQLVEFMSFDNLLYIKSKKYPPPFNTVFDLLNEYRDNMDDPDAERNFKYKVRGITNIIYKPKEFVFLYRFAGLEPNKDYRPPEAIAAKSNEECTNA